MMLVRVLEIPRTRGAFCFGGGEPQLWSWWLELDLFTTDGCPNGDAVAPEEIMEFVKKKGYATPGRPLLILTQRWARTLCYEESPK